jgi:regulator of replication initiation timing
MDKLQRLQMKFSNVQLTMQEIAELVNGLVEENQELKKEIEQLKGDDSSKE